MGPGVTAIARPMRKPVVIRSSIVIARARLLVDVLHGELSVINFDGILMCYHSFF